MSLLLDALKKAAEQKAAKSKDEESESGVGSADETALDVTSREARDSDVDDGSIPRHRLEDETELDHSELETRLEHTRTGFEDRTETGYEPADVTEARTPSPPEQISSGEDETLVFAEDDFTELTEGPSVDQTQFTQRELPEDETEYTQRPPDLEQTEFTEGTPGDQTQFTQRESPEDETEYTQQPPDLEQTEFTEGTLSEDRTDLTQSAAYEPEADSNRTEIEADRTEGVDDDMSLLLVEREQTQFTSPTSITDPQQPQDAIRALKRESPATDDATQADSTQVRADEEQTSSTDTTQTRTRSDTTSTTAPASITQQTTRATLTRTDATATHTYAPDNYDRTLMRLPNDDASKLFAGMKSDSDVVMTPDYAKQVFRSKSSAQRIQHYKAYAGIAVLILLAIGVYGVFEYQFESEAIDSSLRPLKNDPMPGIIRSANAEKNSEPMFAEAEVNERALEIIQNLEAGGTGAEEPGSEPDVVAESAPPVEPAVVTGADTPPTDQSAAVADEPIPQQPAGNSRTAQATSAESTGSSEIAMFTVTDNGTIVGDVSVPLSNTSRSSTSSLQIQLGKRIEEKQLLLREAYDAYRSGNDALALQRYNQVLAIDPGNRDARLGRAAIHVQNGDVATAIEDYQALLLTNPKDSLAMASLIAVANYSPSATETQLKLMMRDEPESPHLNFALANVYGAQNRWQEAQGHYYKALQNNPDDPNYAYNLAVSLEHISQPRAAVSYYRRALENYNNGLAIFSREVVDRRLEKLTQP